MGTVCGPVMLAPIYHTVGGCKVVFSEGSLFLTGMGIRVPVDHADDFPLIQASGLLLVAVATHTRYCVCLDRFANEQIHCILFM